MPIDPIAPNPLAGSGSTEAEQGRDINQVVALLRQQAAERRELLAQHGLLPQGPPPARQGDPGSETPEISQGRELEILQQLIAEEAELLRSLRGQAARVDTVEDPSTTAGPGPFRDE
jgi:hypothetical protein